MSHTEISYWLAATRLYGIGSITLQRLLAQFGEIRKIFSASKAELALCGLTEQQSCALKNPDWHAVERILIWSEKNQCCLLTLNDSRYPTLLREIPDAPVLLYVQGNVQILSHAQLAIVGSRNPTFVGREITKQFAHALATAGLVITSGLALGIDAASHRGALNAKGKTIAVCGTGLKYTYPTENQKLAEEIIAHGGALISEFPPDEKPKAKNFPYRNRIISGLSLGVLVVEAKQRSGSLITARYAVEQGREVFAIPGSIHNPLARGCHQLLRQGAKLVETTQDIFEELGTLFTTLNLPREVAVLVEYATLDYKFQQLIAQIGHETTPLDAIILRSGLTTSEVSSMLLSLELKGYVQAVSGGYVRVINKQ